jgi:hypothetical protein
VTLIARQRGAGFPLACAKKHSASHKRSMKI